MQPYVWAAMPPSSSAQADTQGFSDRIDLLIERAGSVSALAQCCGVTERTVRNWRNGHGDISRDRCLVLARALHISPLWLISGEGCMTDGLAESASPVVDAQDRQPSIDCERLAAALQVLQSYIVLVGGSLSLTQRAEVIAEIYGMLTQPGPSDAGRLIAFHKMLAVYLRKTDLRVYSSASG
ncbi:helix-turn-helix domain-containing protein [Dyella koreensis]|uniref:Helix-turn-helix domain-containing protein n=1 Tax=Dyella koreensis TaxID=311235 RepID=A0ABW8K789_9GAMM